MALATGSKLVAMFTYAAAAEDPSRADQLEAWASFFAAVFLAAAFIFAFHVLGREQWTRKEDQYEA